MYQQRKPTVDRGLMIKINLFGVCARKKRKAGSNRFFFSTACECAPKHGCTVGLCLQSSNKSTHLSTTIPPYFLSWLPTCFPTSNLCTYLLTNIINYLLAYLSTYLRIYLPTYLPYCLILPSFLSIFFNTY